MAANSKDAASQIKEHLAYIQIVSKNIDSAIQQITYSTKEHSSVMHELNSAFAHITGTVETMLTKSI